MTSYRAIIVPGPPGAYTTNPLTSPLPNNINTLSGPKIGPSTAGPYCSKPKEEQLQRIWKQQLTEVGYAKCFQPNCQLAFLSLPGIVAHHKSKCLGNLKPGTFVSCEYCGVKFQHYKSVIIHHEKTHGVKRITYQQPQTSASSELDQPKYIKSSPDDIFNTAQPQQVTNTTIMTPQKRDPIPKIYQRRTPSVPIPEPLEKLPAEFIPESTAEDPVAKSQRLLNESQMISSPRPRGRPRKGTFTSHSANYSGLQYNDPFDINESPRSASRYVSSSSSLPQRSNVSISRTSTPLSVASETVSTRPNIIQQPKSLQKPASVLGIEKPVPEYVTVKTPDGKTVLLQRTSLQAASPVPSTSSMPPPQPSSGDKHLIQGSFISPSNQVVQGGFVATTAANNAAFEVPERPPSYQQSVLDMHPGPSRSPSVMSIVSNRSVANSSVVLEQNFQRQQITTTNFDQRRIEYPEGISRILPDTPIKIEAIDQYPRPSSQNPAFSNVRNQISEEREKSLKEQEEKLAHYEKLVLKSERLAEEARKAAIEERENQLLAWERKLKKREHEARRKIEDAVQLLEETKLTNNKTANEPDIGRRLRNVIEPPAPPPVVAARNPPTGAYAAPPIVNRAVDEHVIMSKSEYEALTNQVRRYSTSAAERPNSASIQRPLPNDDTGPDYFSDSQIYAHQSGASAAAPAGANSRMPPSQTFTSDSDFTSPPRRSSSAFSPARQDGDQNIPRATSRTAHSYTGSSSSIDDGAVSSSEAQSRSNFDLESLTDSDRLSSTPNRNTCTPQSTTSIGNTSVNNIGNASVSNEGNASVNNLGNVSVNNSVSVTKNSSKVPPITSTPMNNLAQAPIADQTPSRKGLKYIAPEGSPPDERDNYDNDDDDDTASTISNMTSVSQLRSAPLRGSEDLFNQLISNQSEPTAVQSESGNRNLSKTTQSNISTSQSENVIVRNLSKLSKESVGVVECNVGNRVVEASFTSHIESSDPSSNPSDPKSNAVINATEVCWESRTPETRKREKSSDETIENCNIDDSILPDSFNKSTDDIAQDYEITETREETEEIQLPERIALQDKETSVPEQQEQNELDDSKVGLVDDNNEIEQKTALNELQEAVSATTPVELQKAIHATAPVEIQKVIPITTPVELQKAIPNNTPIEVPVESVATAEATTNAITLEDGTVIVTDSLQQPLQALLEKSGTEVVTFLASSTPEGGIVILQPSSEQSQNVEAQNQNSSGENLDLLDENMSQASSRSQHENSQNSTGENLDTLDERRTDNISQASNISQTKNPDVQSPVESQISEWQQTVFNDDNQRTAFQENITDDKKHVFDYQKPTVPLEVTATENPYNIPSDISSSSATNLNLISNQAVAFQEKANPHGAIETKMDQQIIITAHAQNETSQSVNTNVDNVPEKEEICNSTEQKSRPHTSRNKSSSCDETVLLSTCVAEKEIVAGTESDVGQSESLDQQNKISFEQSESETTKGVNMVVIDNEVVDNNNENASDIQSGVIDIDSFKVHDEKDSSDFSKPKRNRKRKYDLFVHEDIKPVEENVPLTPRRSKRVETKIANEVEMIQDVFGKRRRTRNVSLSEKANDYLVVGKSVVAVDQKSEISEKESGYVIVGKAIVAAPNEESCSSTVVKTEKVAQSSSSDIVEKEKVAQNSSDIARKEKVAESCSPSIAERKGRGRRSKKVAFEDSEASTEKNIAQETSISENVDNNESDDDDVPLAIKLKSPRKQNKTPDANNDPSKTSRRERSRRSIKLDEPVEPEAEVVETKAVRSSRGRRISYIKKEAVPEEAVELTPSRGRRSARKRKVSFEEEVLAATSEAAVIASALKDVSETPKKKSRKGGNKIECGKCDMGFRDLKNWNLHCSSIHGGMAKPKGEDQNITPEEKETMLKDAFLYAKTVICYVCNVKSFKTWPGLKYHLMMCGKTTEEIEAMKIKCPHCDYRCLPPNMRTHEIKHLEKARNPPVYEVKSYSYDADSATTTPTSAQETTPSGRVKRRAATKAKAIVQKALNEFRTEEDDIGLDPDDDDNYEVENYVDFSDKYIQVGSQYKCLECTKEVNFKSLKEIKNHCLNKHLTDIGNEEDGDYVDEDIEEDDDDEYDEGFPDEDLDDIVEEKRSLASSSTSKKKFGTSVGRDKPCELSAWPEMVRLEHKYRRTHFDQNTFDDFHMSVSDWIQLNEAEIQEYLPNCQNSVAFKVGRGTDPSNKTEHQLSFLEGALVNNSPMFFAGGPIWASAWCPFRSKRDEQILAVSTHKDMDDITYYKSLSGGKNIIQIWGVSMNHAHPKKPEFLYGIAHNYGKIWCMQWCPSGCDNVNNDNKDNKSDSETRLNRYGLLACACSDGTVRIFSISKLDQCQSNSIIFSANPCMTLRFNDPSDQCLSLTWFRGTGHKVIGASYSNGVIALWDITSKSSLLSSLLCDEEGMDENPGKCGTRHPYLSFVAHQSSVSSLDLCVMSPYTGRPRYAVTGSCDRTFHIWDLDNPSVPLQSTKKGLVSDVKWLHHHPGHVGVAFDDVFLQAHTQTLISEIGTRPKTHPIIAQNSAVWSQDYNPWLNTIVVGTSVGEVILYIGPTLHQVLEHDKASNRRRIYLYHTTIENKENSNDISPSKEQNDVYASKYSDVCNKVLNFIDTPIDNLKSCTNEEQLRTRTHAEMPMEDITKYPLASINRVAVNPNLSACHWVFSGSQAGIGRIQMVTSLKSQKVTRALQEAK